MVYRLLALDIDGTLLKSNNRLERDTKDAIDYAKEKGAIVTLVSEREFLTANKVAKALKLNYPIIAHNGAFVSTSLDDPIYTSKIEHEVLLQLVEFLETYKCHIRFSNERLSVGNRPKHKNLLARMTIGISEPLFYPVTFVDSLSDHLHENNESATDLTVELYNDEMAELKEGLKDFFPSIHVQQKDEQQLILTNANTSKYNGLSFLTNYLGISMLDTIAVGDGLEDLEMIEKAGLGVAMRNAPKVIKEKADWVTRSNNMNGVGYMAREVFRKQLKLQMKP